MALNGQAGCVVYVLRIALCACMHLVLRGACMHACPFAACTKSMSRAHIWTGKRCIHAVYVRPMQCTTLPLCVWEGGTHAIVWRGAMVHM